MTVVAQRATPIVLRQVRGVLGLAATVPAEDLADLIERVRGRETDLDTVLGQVIDAVCRELGADRGTLYLVDHANRELVSRAARLPELTEIRLRVGEGVAGWVAEHGDAVLVPDAGSDPRHNPRIDEATGYQTATLMAVPVVGSTSQLLAVLQVLNKATGRFTRRDLDLGGKMADGVAGILEATSLLFQLKPGSRHRLSWRFNNIVGDSPPMKEVYGRVSRAARTAATVLIRGESGTGKELIARAIHYNSPRADRPFVKVDCAALPEHLVENELFGHVAGDYTSADRVARGKVTEAEGGTLFLDEVGELPASVQAKLLRLVQDRSYFPVGASRARQADVRFVCATNRELEEEVLHGRFRQDLYYRLRVVEVPLPPLRARGHDDLERLIDHFLDRFRHEHGRPDLVLSAPSRAALHAHGWPGNVRELENCIESAVVLTPGVVIGPDQLPLGRSPQPARSPHGFSSDLVCLRDVELAYIRHVLQVCGGNRTKAARLLGIGRNTLIRRLREGG